MNQTWYPELLYNHKQLKLLHRICGRNWLDVHYPIFFLWEHERAIFPKPFQYKVGLPV